MDSLTKFETETYPRMWSLAYNEGVEAKKQGLSRTCNLQNSQFFTPSGNILKVYLSAWEQGWDNRKIPEVFNQIEAALKNMPLRPCRIEDL